MNLKKKFDKILHAKKIQQTCTSMEYSTEKKKKNRRNTQKQYRQNSWLKWKKKNIYFPKFPQSDLHEKTEETRYPCYLFSFIFVYTFLNEQWFTVLDRRLNKIKVKLLNRWSRNKKVKWKKINKTRNNQNENNLSQ